VAPEGESVLHELRFPQDTDDVTLNNDDHRDDLLRIAA
jgi:hypothetical protein